MKAPDFLTKAGLDSKKIFLGLLILGLVGYLDYSFVIKLQLNRINSARAKITKVKNDIEKIKKEAALIKSAPPAALKDKEVIAEGQMPVLLEAIANLANKNNVRIIQIKQARQLGAKASTPTLTPTKVSSTISPYYIILDLSAGYHELGGFICALENLDKFIAAEQIKISRSSTQYLNQSVNLVLRTYVKK